MSDPDRQTEIIPAAKGVAPSGGQVLAGFLLILFGLCLFLVGGGCTSLWVTILLSSSGLNGSESPGLLLISLVAFFTSKASGSNGPCHSSISSCCSCFGSARAVR